MLLRNKYNHINTKECYFILYCSITIKKAQTTEVMTYSCNVQWYLISSQTTWLQETLLQRVPSLLCYRWPPYLAAQSTRPCTGCVFELRDKVFFPAELVLDPGIWGFRDLFLHPSWSEIAAVVKEVKCFQAKLNVKLCFLCFWCFVFFYLHSIEAVYLRRSCSCTFWFSNQQLRTNQLQDSQKEREKEKSHHTRSTTTNTEPFPTPGGASLQWSKEASWHSLAETLSIGASVILFLSAAASVFWKTDRCVLVGLLKESDKDKIKYIKLRELFCCLLHLQVSLSATCEKIEILHGLLL